VFTVEGEVEDPMSGSEIKVLGLLRVEGTVSCSRGKVDRMSVEIEARRD